MPIAVRRSKSLLVAGFVACLLSACASHAPRSTESPARTVSVRTMMELAEKPGDFEQLARYLGAEVPFTTPPLEIRVEGPTLAGYGKIEEITMWSLHDGVPSMISMRASTETCIDLRRLDAETGAKAGTHPPSPHVDINDTYVWYTGVIVAFRSRVGHPGCLGSILFRNDRH